MRSLKATLAALCLAACGDPAADRRPSAADAPAEPPELQAIPAAFQGVWAATPADCAPPAETRLEIAADHLRFYESSGPLASVTSPDPSEIHIVVALSGEGALSQRSFRYRLIEDGRGLFDVRNGLTRIRCQAG